jgi:hypothetical protein
MSPAKEPAAPQPGRQRDQPARASAPQTIGPAPAVGQLPGRATGGPSPRLMRQLQQTIGNRAVGAALQGATRPIQRALPDAAQYLALDVADLLLVAVGTAVASYNAIAASRGTAGDLQTCFNRLQGVDRAIHAWFAQVSAANQRLQGNPHSAAIRLLLTAAEQEHQGLVTASRAFATVLPMDTTGLDDVELGQLRTLWQDIVNSRGKIKLVGSAGYNQRVLSELGKILATPTGRAMLRFLNIPKDGEIADSAAAALTNIYIGEALSDLGAAVKLASPELGEQHRSEAQPLNMEEKDLARNLEAMTEVKITPIVLGAEPDPADYPPVTAATIAQVRTAAWSGRRGFTHAGKKYEFNQGTGSFVTSFPGNSVHPAKGTGNEILTPGWVTLGHELGHSANMKAGATTIKQKSIDPFTSDLAGGAAAAKKWDNAEELLNIENVENALRGEAGLTEREGHQPPEWVQAHAKRTRAELMAPLERLYKKDITWWQDAEWLALHTKYRLLKADETLDDGAVDRLRDEFTAFLQNKTAALLPGYLLQISKNQAKATLLLNALDPAGKRDAMIYLHANQARFTQIKAYLHMGFFKRRVSNKTEREAARVDMLVDLALGRQVVP